MGESPEQFVDHRGDRAHSTTRDNILAESTIGLLKTEAVSKSSRFLKGPIKTIDDIEFATIEWVDWFNARRLHSTLDYVPPDEFEAVYYSQLSILQPEMSPA